MSESQTVIDFMLDVMEKLGALLATTSATKEAVERHADKIDDIAGCVKKMEGKVCMIEGQISKSSTHIQQNAGQSTGVQGSRNEVNHNGRQLPANQQ